MALQIGKHYRGLLTGNIYRIVDISSEGIYRGVYKDNTQSTNIFESMVERIEDEDYDDEGGESTMKIKIGDKITLKKWGDIDQENRRPVSDGVKIHPIKDHKKFYDQTTPIEVISLPGNRVVGISLPLKSAYFSYWDILEKDIYEVLGSKPKSKFRVLRTSLPEVEEAKVEAQSLKEIEINLGEAFLLKIDGGEAIKVCIERSDIHKDDGFPKSSKRIQLFGTIVPTETIRRIRG